MLTERATYGSGPPLDIRVDQVELSELVDQFIAASDRARTSSSITGYDQAGEAIGDLRLRACQKGGQLREQLLMIDQRVKILVECENLALVLSTLNYLR